MSRSEQRQARRERRKRSPIDSLPFRPLHNTLPPLELLSAQQLDRIHEASMRILEEIGIDFLDREALELWEAAGARVDYNTSHVWIDRRIVLDAVAKAPSQFTLRARNPAKSVTIGGNTIVFVTTSGTAFVTDLDKGRREGSLADYQLCVKLAHSCPQIHVVESQITEPQDLPVEIRHLARMLTVYTHTDKAVACAAHGRRVASDCVKMAAIIFGGEDEIRKQPVFASIVNANSPLRYDSSMLGGLITYARAGQPLVVTPFILAGAMSPVTMVAALAQQNAEALAGVALTQLVNPGVPVIYGGFTTNTDLATGGPAFGTPEGGWAFFAGAQLARRYGVPYRGSGGLTTSKVCDAQAAYETQMCLWPTIMSHTNYVMHAAGWLEGGLTFSFEKFILDVEQLAMMQHMFQEVPLDDDALALDSIREVGPGGHHFGTAHTLARYETVFYRPIVSDRQNLGAWEDAGSQDAAQRANRIWKELLASYEPPALDPTIEQELRAFVSERRQELGM